jgi:hypothetical protein
MSRTEPVMLELLFIASGETFPSQPAVLLAVPTL